MAEEERNEATAKATTEEPEEQAEEKPAKTFTQEQLDQIVAERLERKDKKQAEEKAETERKARESALEDQEKYKELSEQRGEELVGLKSQTETLEAERDDWKTKAEGYEEILQGQWESRKEGVPDYVLDAISERSISDRLKYLDDHADKFGQTNGQRPAGSRPTGKVQHVPKREHDKDAREGQRQSRVSAI